MVDILRGNLKRLVAECPSIVLERDDIEDLLSGHIQDIIDREKGEDETIRTISISNEDGPNDIIDDNSDTLFNLFSKSED